jgi:hypothetical protein
MEIVRRIHAGSGGMSPCLCAWLLDMVVIDGAPPSVMAAT